ncbi:FAD:protein FMN transferase [Mollicutes bacterium LVI A0039]|nr:FAD:protein FMN transferase [Mollicutes bacterium LVI A0039]
MKKILLIPLLLIIMSGCQSKPEITELNYFNFDTSISIKIYDDINQRDIKSVDQQVTELLERLENTYSPSIESSTVNQINNRQNVEVTEEFINVLSKSIEACQTSGYKYDPSSGALIDLWSINNENNLPKPEQIDAARTSVGCQEVSIEQNKVVMPEGYQLDFGSSIKGYAGDQIALILQEAGVENALINLGGNIQAVGNKYGNPFQLGIIRPEIDNDFNENVLQMPLEDQAMVTSGINQRFFVSDDVIYHHIIDATTGYPANNNLASVTIITESGMDADILSTMIFLLGLDQGYEFITNLEGVEAIFITQDKKIYQTTDLGIELLDDSYQIVSYE